jgi:hypothetical protein
VKGGRRLAGIIQRFLTLFDHTPTAKIVEKAHLAGFDNDYRLPGDTRNVIRINQNWPEGIGASLIKKIGPLRDGVRVTGVSQKGAKKNLIALISGAERSIELRREPANPHDRNAISVIGHWQNAHGSAGSGQIGWVAADIAKDIGREYPSEPIGGKINMMFKPVRGKNPGIRIDIGRPSKSRKKSGKK